MNDNLGLEASEEYLRFATATKGKTARFFNKEIVSSGDEQRKGVSEKDQLDGLNSEVFPSNEDYIANTAKG